MRGRNPSADSAAGMAGRGSGRLHYQHHKPFWPQSDKSDSKKAAKQPHGSLPHFARTLSGHIAQSGVKPLLPSYS